MMVLSVSLAKERDRVFQLLRKSGLTIATAESCTGGLLAKALTDLSGSSEFFRGGVVTYTNEVKARVLGVPLSEHESAVTKKVALEMAKGARQLFRSELALATTGYMTPVTAMKATLKRKSNAPQPTGFFFVALSGLIIPSHSKQRPLKTTTITKTKGSAASRKKMPLIFSKNSFEICFSYELFDTRSRNRLSASMLSLRVLSRILSQLTSEE